MRKCVMVVGLGLLAVVGCKSDEPHRLDHASAEKVAMVMVPPKTVEAYQKDHPDVRLERVRKIIKDNGDVHYEFRYTDADGRKGEAEYDSAGLKARP